MNNNKANNNSTEKYFSETLRPKARGVGFWAVFVILLYLVFLTGEFLSPYGSESLGDEFKNVSAGKIDPSQLRFWQRGEKYKLFEVFEMDVHFLGFEGERVFVFGSDYAGRDVLGLVLKGGAVDMTLGLMSGLLAGLIGWLMILALSSNSSLRYIFNKAAAIAVPIPGILFLFILVFIVNLVQTVPLNFWVFAGVLMIFGAFRICSRINVEIEKQNDNEFVKFARYNGASDGYIFKKHIYFLIRYKFLYEVFLFAALVVGYEMLLSFLGIGLKGNYMSFGWILRQSFAEGLFRPWQAISVSFIASIAIWSIYFVARRCLKCQVEL